MSKYENRRRVLLVNITRLGDMIQSTPTIAGIKMENPDSHITVLVERQFAGVCADIPYIDKVISLDFSRMIQFLNGGNEGLIDAYHYFSEIVDDLRRCDFDYCLNMSNSAYTALLLKMLGIEDIGGWISDDEGFRRIESDWAKLFAANISLRNRHYNSFNLVDTFRASADIEKQPNHLVIELNDTANRDAQELLREFDFKGNGPLIAVQAGASQGKRQWAPRYFAKMIELLGESLSAHFIMTGTKKEMPIIEEIVNTCSYTSIGIAAGKTSIRQLASILALCDVTVTGDTGTMHMSVASKTPVVSLFLASAYGFETGPYSTGNIVIQPIIECGPCNPNNTCGRPDCHEFITPQLVASVTEARLKEDFSQLQDDSILNQIESEKVTVYRTSFDEFNYYQMIPVHPVSETITHFRLREAYRRLWLDELEGLIYSRQECLPFVYQEKQKKLQAIETTIDHDGFDKLLDASNSGRALISELLVVIRDKTSPPIRLGELSEALAELDMHIETLGYHYGFLNPVVRMFVFAKENLEGNEPEDLSLQMDLAYESLGRRISKLRELVEKVTRYSEQIPLQRQQYNSETTSCEGASTK